MKISRRRVLALVGTSSFSAIAGCSWNDSNSDIDLPDFSNIDFLQPNITEHAATPENNAKELVVRLVGEDNKGLRRAAIRYGDSFLEERPDAKEVELEGTLDDVHQQDVEEPGTVQYFIEDTAGNEVRETHRPDEEPPAIDSYVLATTEKAGELRLAVNGHDNAGLGTFSVDVGSVADVTDIRGQQTIETSGTIYADHPEVGDAITPFQRNQVDVELTDWAGNTARETESAYVRKYDTMEDTRLNFSARYIPYAADALGRCLDAVETKPAVGDYGTGTNDPISAEITTKHIDQMTGHGITRLTLVFNGKDRDFGYVNGLLEADNIDQIQVEPSYSVLAFWHNEERDWREDVLPEHLTFLREKLMSRENAARYQGRPTLHTWYIINLANDDTYREKIAEEFGGFEQLVNDIRDHLRVDGRDPFLIAGTGGVDNYLYRNADVKELVTQFDAVCPWIGADLNPEEKKDWETGMEETERVYSEQSGFADRNGMEFIPTVFPGFNDKENTCHTFSSRHLPRSQEQFRKVLELADKYRSTEMVNTATWNDWVEGTQIEPGAYRGTDYGEEYLEIVREFQLQ